jgi:hypothetical protein
VKIGWKRVQEIALEHTVRLIVGVLIGLFFVVLFFVRDWAAGHTTLRNMPNWSFLLLGLLVLLLLFDWLQLRISKARNKTVDKYAGFQVTDEVLGFAYKVKEPPEEWIEEDDLRSKESWRIEQIVGGPIDVVGDCYGTAKAYHRAAEIIPMSCPFCNRDTQILSVTARGNAYFAVTAMKRAVLMRLQKDFRLGARVGVDVSYTDVPYQAVQG